MPWKSIEEVPPQVQKHNEVPLTLPQANKWGEIFDAIREGGMDASVAAAIAWKQWEKLYRLDNTRGTWKKLVARLVSTEVKTK